MRILLIGATGTIGKAIAAALGGRHEVLLASRQQAPKQSRIMARQANSPIVLEPKQHLRYGILRARSLRS